MRRPASVPLWHSARTVFVDLGACSFDEVLRYSSYSSLNIVINSSIAVLYNIKFSESQCVFSIRELWSSSLFIPIV